MNFLSIISWASDAIDGQTAALVAWVNAGFGTLFGDIGEVNAFAGGLAKAVGSIFTGLWAWLQNLWQWFQTHILQRLQDLINTIKEKLQKIFGPLLCHLKTAIDTYRKLWNTYVKPLYDFLQRIRRVLVIFRLLGFKWAQKLDARIVALETAITNSFLGVLANLNRIADWLNYILDPYGLFQPGVWLGSIGASVGAIIGIVFGQMQAPTTGGTALQFTPPADYMNYSSLMARMQARSLLGTLPDDDAIITDLRATAAALGYPR